MNERFAVMEDRIDRLVTHVDGFMNFDQSKNGEADRPGDSAERAGAGG
jgi:hypothetical protein